MSDQPTPLEQAADEYARKLRLAFMASSDAREVAEAGFLAGAGWQAERATQTANEYRKQYASERDREDAPMADRLLAAAKAAAVAAVLTDLRIDAAMSPPTIG